MLTKVGRADRAALEEDASAIQAFTRCLFGSQFCPGGVPVEDLEHFTAEIDKSIGRMRAVAQRYGFGKSQAANLPEAVAPVKRAGGRHVRCA